MADDYQAGLCIWYQLSAARVSAHDFAEKMDRKTFLFPENSICVHCVACVYIVIQRSFLHCPSPHLLHFYIQYNNGTTSCHIYNRSLNFTLILLGHYVVSLFR